jgi:hypothetical protein
MELAKGYLEVLRKATASPHDGPKSGQTGGQTTNRRKGATLI